MRSSRRCALASSSCFSTPASTSSPRPICPTVRPSTATLASLTRCISPIMCLSLVWQCERTGFYLGCHNWRHAIANKRDKADTVRKMYDKTYQHDTHYSDVPFARPASAMNFMISLARRLVAMLCVTALFWLSNASADTVRIGVLASRPKPDTLRQWKPLAAALKRAIPQHDFEIKAYVYPELEQAVSTNQVA